ncbi:MAG: type II secretion system GspH family protein, partial [Meiothermus silvanus]|nr:type II secretion system GspH family protein [Allomeiothermus silvanus]
MRRRGLTIVEVLVALAVLGVVAGAFAASLISSMRM